MATRSEKEARARELIAASPEAGRRTIAKQLRSEGLGLRDVTILALQREAYPERRRIIVEPYQLANPVSGRYKQVRESRYNKLVKANFTAGEARKLLTLPLTRLTFIKDMVQSRKKLVDSIMHQGKQLKWSKTQSKAELKAFIDYTYKQEGWEDKEGDSDIWAMLRSFRSGAIDRGEYAARPRRAQSSSRRETYRSRRKEHIKSYAADYRSKRKEQIKAYAADYRQKAKR